MLQVDFLSLAALTLLVNEYRGIYLLLWLSPEPLPHGEMSHAFGDNHSVRYEIQRPSEPPLSFRRKKGSRYVLPLYGLPQNTAKQLSFVRRADKCLAPR